MLRNTLLWILAIAITLGSAVYQRRTGPTYPVEGSGEISESVVEYELLRSHGGEGDQPVIVEAPDTVVTGFLVYRRYNTNDEWTRISMDREGERLVSAIPHQPPAGKIEYHVELQKGKERLFVPSDENIVTRFKGAVPGSVLLVHVILIFAAMLVSTRTGLEAIFSTGNLKIYTIWAFGLMLVGGMVMGPIVQKYAFGAFWTGFPFGTDLTDNKTLIAFVAWIIALIAVLLKSRARTWVLVASIVTLVIFMIPHSLHGSELDYSKLEEAGVERPIDHSIP
jgi:hypothetical protein